MPKNNLNIENIMEEIRAQVEEINGYDVEYEFEKITMPEADSQAMAHRARYLIDGAAARRIVQPERPIEGNPLAVFIKKIMRKMLRFYVHPNVFAQNDYNYFATESMYLLWNLQSETDKQNRTIHSELDQLCCEVAKMKKEQTRYDHKDLDAVMEENRQLKAKVDELCLMLEEQRGTMLPEEKKNR